MPRARQGDYQQYWRRNISRIARLIKQVYQSGESGSISLEDLRSVGQRQRQNWRGHVTLSSKGIADHRRYYVLYLGEALLESGTLAEYGDTVFRLDVAPDLILEVRKLSA